jgi:hypothetical protein
LHDSIHLHAPTTHEPRRNLGRGARFTPRFFSARTRQALLLKMPTSASSRRVGSVGHSLGLGGGCIAACTAHTHIDFWPRTNTACSNAHSHHVIMQSHETIATRPPTRRQPNPHPKMSTGMFLLALQRCGQQPPLASCACTVMVHDVGWVVDCMVGLGEVDPMK